MKKKIETKLDIHKGTLLKDYTTYGVGGPAEYFFVAKNLNTFKEALDWAKDKKLEVTILGNGSNVVISDKGLKGLVIVNKSNGIKVEKDTVTADSGVQLKSLVDKVLKEGKGGIEFLANIPGTVGGAVAGNAGCYGQFVGDILRKSTVYQDGVVEVVGKGFFEYGYRSSKIKRGHHAIVLDATLEIKMVDVKESKKVIKEDKTLRSSKHPKEPSCGSFFENPSKENPAGKIIEESGLKGYSIGGAKISEKHANFVVNTGKVKASDIYRLSAEVRKKVKEKTGIELKEEVKYLGKF